MDEVQIKNNLHLFGIYYVPNIMLSNFHALFIKFLLELFPLKVTMHLTQIRFKKLFLCMFNWEMQEAVSNLAEFVLK